MPQSIHRGKGQDLTPLGSNNPVIVSEGLTDLAADSIAAVTPFVPAGSSKVARALDDGIDAVKNNGASKAMKGEGPDIGSQNVVSKKPPEPDGGFTADLSETKAKSRSGHSYAGNKQYHEKMKNDPEFRKEQEAKHGDDVYERTSTSGGGRRNPRNTEWDHNSKDPKKLDLRTKENHAAKTRTESKGGYAKFHKQKVTGTVRVSGKIESNRLKKLDEK